MIFSRLARWTVVAQHLPSVDPSDGELITAVRGGDVDAYGELFVRHVEAARRLARQLVPGADVDDLVSEAFAKVLAVLQRGAGPDLAFRAYLLTAVRRLHVDRIRATARLHTTDDLAPFDPGVPFHDTAVAGFESATAARAYASLPERWQAVLWHTEVEGQKPAEVAPLLGMSANSVSALAYRAREGLRQAFVSMHAQDAAGRACARTRANLGPYVRGGLSRRDGAQVERHLEGCRPCAAIYLELVEVNSDLRGLLAPLLLGAAAAAYVGAGAAAGGMGVALGGAGALVGRVRDALTAYAPTAAVAGVASTAVVAGLYVALQPDPPDVSSTRDVPVATAPPSGTDRPAPTSAPSRRPAVPAPGTAGAATPSTLRPAPPGASDPASDPATGPAVPAMPTGASGPAGSPPATPGGSPTGPGSAPTSPPTTVPTRPPSAPPQSPLVQLGASVSTGPDALGVGADVQVLGLPVPPVSLSVPLPRTP